MATKERLKPAYLDLRLPGRAVAQLRAWGERLGMSAEGMARMLLLMRVHELLSDVVDEATSPATASDDDGSQSLEVWRARLQSIGVQSDELPAPYAVNGETRIYHVNDFVWPEGATPQWEYAHIGGDGSIGVSRKANA